MGHNYICSRKNQITAYIYIISKLVLDLIIYIIEGRSPSRPIWNFAFGKCLYETFSWKKCMVKDLVPLLKRERVKLMFLFWINLQMSQQSHSFNANMALCLCLDKSSTIKEVND